MTDHCRTRSQILISKMALDCKAPRVSPLHCQGHESNALVVVVLHRVDQCDIESHILDTLPSRD